MFEHSWHLPVNVLSGKVPLSRYSDVYSYGHLTGHFILKLDRTGENMIDKLARQCTSEDRVIFDEFKTLVYGHTTLYIINVNLYFSFLKYLLV